MTIDGALRRVHAILEFVNEQHVVLPQRRHHRVGRNVKRSDNERNKEERGKPGDDKGIQVFAHSNFGATGFETERDARDRKNTNKPQKLERRKRQVSGQLSSL